MKNLQQWSAVQELRRRGKNVSEIARELGMSRTTVRKLLKQKEAPKFHRTLYFSKIDPYLYLRGRINPKVTVVSVIIKNYRE